jgi:pimeloyl-ACP methyl ester carboxylesterase
MKMPQLVFIHGPGAGGCADSFDYQLRHFPGSLAPHLPGHLEGEACPDVEHYAEWLRGWLWAQGHKHDLVLVGFTLGACIGLRYALEYPNEVAALVLMTVAIRPKERPPGAYEMRLNAANNAGAYQKWLEYQEHALMFVKPPLRERLMERHRQVGPLSQYRDLVAIDRFDVRDRIGSLRAPLVLIRGLDDPTSPPEYELEIQEKVPGSRYVKLKGAGHFPMAERPDEVNREIENLLASLDAPDAKQ